MKKHWLIMTASALLSGCGFYLQGPMQLAPPLLNLNLQTADPYSPLTRNLEQSLKMSHVNLVDKEYATTTLAILSYQTSQNLISVSGTQQTRQYNLKASVAFEILDAKGVTIAGPFTLDEAHVMTVQSNQILGSSNESNLFYQQMQRTLAYDMMNRISSKEVTEAVNKAFSPKTNAKKTT